MKRSLPYENSILSNTYDVNENRTSFLFSRASAPQDFLLIRKQEVFFRDSGTLRTMNFLQRIGRLMRNPRSFARQLRLLLDYVLFRLRYGFLRVQAPRSNDVALIINFHETPYKAITEGLMAQAFGRAGLTPVVLTIRGCKWVQRYSEALGVDRILLYENYTDASKKTQDAELIRAFLSHHPTLPEMLGFSFQGIVIGTHVLSTVLRWLHVGSVDLDDPAIRSMVTDGFLRSITAVRAANTLLDTCAPKVLIFNEAGYTPYGEFYQVALQRNLNVVQYLYSQRLDGFMLKHCRTSENMLDAISLSAATWEHVQQMPWGRDEEELFMRDTRRHYEENSWFNFTLSLKKVHKSPDAVRTQLGLDPAKKTAVIFTHVVWDASFFFGKNLFTDYDEWLVETVKIACDNPHLNWVIKLHPDYIWHTKGMQNRNEMRDMIAVIANVGSLPPHITIVPPDTDLSTYAFFAVTDYCLTVRGTIGIECPCFGIPVLTAGIGRYSGMGFTEDSPTQEEYRQKLRTLHTLPPLSPERTTLARRHAYGLFVLRPLVCTSFGLIPLYRDGDVFDHRVLLHAKSLRDIEEDPGLRSLTRWALQSGEEDYLCTMEKV